MRACGGVLAYSAGAVHWARSARHAPHSPPLSLVGATVGLARAFRLLSLTSLVQEMVRTRGVWVNKIS